jgi:hypothetical protein
VPGAAIRSATPAKTSAALAPAPIATLIATLIPALSLSRALAGRRPLAIILAVVPVMAGRA